MIANDAVLAVVDALDSACIPYMLVGSYSSNVYGIDRSTQDADFVIELGDTAFGELTRRLPPEIQVDPQMGFETITATSRYVAEVSGTVFRIELFLLSADPHDQERFRRRLAVPLLGRQVWLPSVEDVIVMKLRWALLGGRSKDRDDARNVIAVQEGEIDWPYVHSWCDRHGTRALLDEIRRSIPPI